MSAATIRAVLRALWRLLAALVGAGALYLKGRADARDKAAAKADRAAIETMERIEDAKNASAAGGGAWHERLRRDTRPD